MAPGKILKVKPTVKSSILSGLPANSRNTINDQNNMAPTTRGGKRKAEGSPIRNDKAKRSALGNLTNAVNNAKDSQAIVLGTRKRDIVVPIKKTTSTTITATNSVSSGAVLLAEKKPVVESIKNEKSLLMVVPIGDSTTTKNSSLPSTRPTKVLTRAAARASSNVPNQQQANTTQMLAAKQKKEQQQKLSEQQQQQQHQQLPPKAIRRISNEFEKSKTEDDSLYMSALDSL